MVELRGIEETKDVLEFIKDLATVIRDARADGKLDIFDAVKALKLAPSLTAAVRGADEVKAELSEMTGEERDYLLNEMKDCVYQLVEALT